MELGRIYIQGALIGAAITVVMCVADGVFFFNNQSLQTEVDQRQKFINDSANLARLSENLTKALASSAYTHNDDAIRQMLHDLGIDYTVTPAAQTPANSSER